MTSNIFTDYQQYQLKYFGTPPEVLDELGIAVLFLPVYSPDFNPIELMWAYMKCILRKLKDRTNDALIDASIQALDYITPELIVSWFKHSNHTHS